MNIKLLLSAVIAASSSLVGMDLDSPRVIKVFSRENSIYSKIEHTVAKEWTDVEPYKDPVYIPFFEKAGFNKPCLNERWLVLEKFFKTTIPTITLLHKKKLSLERDQDPIGFLTMQNDGKNTLFYTSPVLVEKDKIDDLIKSVIENVFPKTEDAYCLAHAENPYFQQFLVSLGWKQVETCPIEPNKDFIGDTPFVVFNYTIKNLK